MNIIFEKTSAPETYGGNVRSLAPHHALKMRRELNSFDGRARSGFAQTVIDILSIAAGVALACATGIGIAFAFFVLLFVKL